MLWSRFHFAPCTWCRPAIAAALLPALLCFAMPAGAQCDPGETVIKFSHVVAPSGQPKGDAAKLLAKRVNTEMDGRACMKVYPNSVLYDDDKVMEALLIGDVQLAAPSMSKLEAYTLKYRLFDLPFLFKDLGAVSRFSKSDAGVQLLGAIDDFGYRGLGYWSSGLKQFSADLPLIEPGDANGLKFRVQISDVAVAMIEAVGGSAQPLSLADVFGALSTGVVDGQENSWSNIFTQQFFKVQNGITETNHQLLFYLLVTTDYFLESLEPEVRTQFLRIVDEVTVTANANVIALEARNRQNILDAGGTVRELSPEQRQRWIDAMAPVWDQFRNDIGEDLIEAAVKSNRE